MTGDRLIQLSAGRMYLGQNAIRRLGDEAARLGRRALILADEAAWAEIGTEVRAALKTTGVEWELLFHTGHCCPSSYGRARKQACRMEADMIIGIGGGRLLDTAKIAADQAQTGCVTVPTSAATCAAAAWLSVEYTDEGAFVGNYWTKCPPSCMIADTGFIVRKCPVRLNLAGIVDAMAKYPEIAYNLNDTGHFSRNAFSEVAVDTAKNIYQFFAGHFEELKEKYQQGVVDQVTEDAVAKAVAITGLVSGLACGGKQAAVAHLIYSYVCNHSPQAANGFLHGEIVGASLCYQIVIDGWEVCEAERLRGLLNGAGMPACLADLGLSADAAQQERIFSYLDEKLNLSQNERIRFREPQNARWLFGAL